MIEQTQNILETQPLVRMENSAYGTKRRMRNWTDKERRKLANMIIIIKKSQSEPLFCPRGSRFTKIEKKKNEGRVKKLKNFSPTTFSTTLVRNLFETPTVTITTIPCQSFSSRLFAECVAVLLTETVFLTKQELSGRSVEENITERTSVEK